MGDDEPVAATSSSDPAQAFFAFATMDKAGAPAAAAFCRFPYLLAGFGTGASVAASVLVLVMTSDLVRRLLLRRRTGPRCSFSCSCSCSCCDGGKGKVSSSGVGVDIDVDDCSRVVKCKLAVRRDNILRGTCCCGCSFGTSTASIKTPLRLRLCCDGCGVGDGLSAAWLRQGS